jgi:hypothetical protein
MDAKLRDELLAALEDPIARERLADYFRILREWSERKPAEAQQAEEHKPVAFTSRSLRRRIQLRKKHIKALRGKA